MTVPFSPLPASWCFCPSCSLPLVSPLFVWLTVFVGLNLLQSAFTGFCPAAMVFRKLGVKPGSRVLGAPECAGSSSSARCWRARRRFAGTLTLAPTTVTEWKAVYGRVEARDTVPARARIGGLVVDLTVTEGELVKAGQKIATVQDDKIAFQVAALDAQIARAEGTAGNGASPNSPAARRWSTRASSPRNASISSVPKSMSRATSLPRPRRSDR